MRFAAYAAVAFATTIVTSPATAGDRLGYTAIAAGDVAQAEATLERERAIYRDRPEIMLNLAAIYARTDRVAAARALYRKVLEVDATEMELPGGAGASSHLLAQRGLARLDYAVAAR